MDKNLQDLLKHWAELEPKRSVFSNDTLYHDPMFALGAVLEAAIAHPGADLRIKLENSGHNLRLWHATVQDTADYQVVTFGTNSDPAAAALEAYLQWLELGKVVDEAIGGEL